MKKSVLSLLVTGVMLATVACTSSTVDVGSSEVQSTTSGQEITNTEESVSVTETESAAVTIEAEDTKEADVSEIWAPDIAQRQEMKADGYLCAVAYIGYVDAEMTGIECAEVFYNSRYNEEYPTITDFPEENCIDDCSGYELYLVIPVDENATVSVNEWLLTEENEYAGESGQVYYRSEAGAPVLIKCNVSDIMPNVVVNIVDSDGNSVQWCPSLSLKDGSVSRYGVEDKVCDITHYIYNETYDCYLIEGEAQ